MPEVGFTNLLVVFVIAPLAPLALGVVPRVPMPAVVLEIVVGVASSSSSPGSRSICPGRAARCCASLGLVVPVLKNPRRLDSGLGQLGLVDKDTSTHPQFRTRLEALGYGFLIPVSATARCCP